MENRNHVRCLTEAALCTALAVVLSKLELFRLPQGGSVTLEIVPMLLFARRWGTRRGIMAGIANGALQWALGGYVITPLQGLLDYPLAYASMGLAALTASCPIGILIAVAARIACHTASGVVFFAEYAPQGTHPLIYSLAYNGSFMLANAAIAAVLLPLIDKRLPE